MIEKKDVKLMMGCASTVIFILGGIVASILWILVTQGC